MSSKTVCSKLPEHLKKSHLLKCKKYCALFLRKKFSNQNINAVFCIFRKGGMPFYSIGFHAIRISFVITYHRVRFSGNNVGGFSRVKFYNMWKISVKDQDKS